MTKTNRIKACFEKNTKASQKMLITYFMAGHPTLEQSEQVVSAAIEAGADIVELGIPFTDPLADGPVIEQAGLRALAKGINVEKVLSLVKNIRVKYDTPIVIMSYFNPIYKMGIVKFTKQAVQAGVDGLIIPDLPFGEDEELYQECSNNGIQLIPLVVNSTDDHRLIEISKREPAFIYCISANGITGVRQTINPDMQDFLDRVRNLTNRPIGVGFGIGTGEQAKIAAKNCDAVIMGSALVGLVAEYSQQEDLMIDKLTTKVSEIKQSIAG